MFRIAVYKALYRLFGGFVADVVAAIDQVCNTTMIKINKKRKKRNWVNTSSFAYRVDVCVGVSLMCGCRCVSLFCVGE